MNKEISRLVKRTLRKSGVDIRLSKNVRPTFFPEAPPLHPLAAAYLAYGRSPIVRVPISSCISFRYLSFDCLPTSKSPFIRTLSAYANEGCRTYEASPLATFYKDFQPKSAAEIMGISNSACQALAKAPPASAPLLWSPKSLEHHLKQRQKSASDESRVRGSRLGLEHGDQFYGPVSEKKGRLEFFRLTSIFDKIRNKTFKVCPHGVDNIGGIVLLHENEEDYKIFIYGGQHRIAALCVLGYPYVDIQLHNHATGGIVRRRDSNHWPAVLRGYLTEREAVQIFDRIFEGKQPEGFHVDYR